MSRGCATRRLGGVAAAVPRRRGAQRFEDTDRWARGRIVAALVAREPLPALEAERLERALAGLERDGLVVREGGGRVRLP
jgi:A/G-specific adenine glycosylase